MSAEAWPGGLCPRCLLRGALAEDSTSEPYTQSSAATLTSGTTFGPFVIIELLGKGGMASVYHAYEAELDRDVALNIFYEAACQVTSLVAAASYRYTTHLQ